MACVVLSCSTYPVHLYNSTSPMATKGVVWKLVCSTVFQAFPASADVTKVLLLPGFPGFMVTRSSTCTALCRCFKTRQITEALLRRNYHDKLPHQIPAAASAQEVLRLYYRKAKKRLAAENDDAADATAEEEGEEDVEEDADDENVAAAQGQAAIQAASEAASDGITGSTSAHHMMEILAQLPDSQRAAEDAAAASGKGLQQNEKWLERNQKLARMVAEVEAGKRPQYRRGDDRYQQLQAELLQLQQELPTVDAMSWNKRTWEVRAPCQVWICSTSNQSVDDSMEGLVPARMQRPPCGFGAANCECPCGAYDADALLPLMLSCSSP